MVIGILRSRIVTKKEQILTSVQVGNSEFRKFSVGTKTMLFIHVCSFRARQREKKIQEKMNLWKLFLLIEMQKEAKQLLYYFLLCFRKLVFCFFKDATWMRFHWKNVLMLSWNPNLSLGSSVTILNPLISSLSFSAAGWMKGWHGGEETSGKITGQDWSFIPPVSILWWQNLSTET